MKSTIAFGVIVGIVLSFLLLKARPAVAPTPACVCYIESAGTDFGVSLCGDFHFSTLSCDCAETPGGMRPSLTIKGACGDWFEMVDAPSKVYP